MLVTTLLGFQQVILAATAFGSCEPQWAEGFEAIPSGINGSVYAFARFDDGNGEALYVGGYFTLAGDVNANNIAKWDGQAWSALGFGTNGPVYALAAFDPDDDGPERSELYVGGSFTSADGSPALGLARWNGSVWSSVANGPNNTVTALAAIDLDGNGPGHTLLYVGGRFSSPAVYVASWDGQSWSTLGTGSTNSNLSGVDCFAVFDDGGGPALFVGGSFYTIRGIAASSIAKWNGSAWSAVGTGVNSSVNALAVFDDGVQESLYVGGDFSSAGGVRAPYIAKWSGTVWSPLRDELNGPVYALAVDPSQGQLFAAGNFLGVGTTTVNRIAKWDGSRWSPVGSGVSGNVNALINFDDGTSSSTYVGGDFTSAGGATARSIAKVDGNAWSPLQSGNGASDRVDGLDVLDVGSGEILYARGSFRAAGNVVSGGIAEWNGSEWRSLAGGVADGTVRAVAVYDDQSGGGPALFAAGSFTNIGGVPAKYIARWDGVGWHSLTSGTNLPIDALAVYDDGSGAQLYAACDFFVAGGVPVNRIARWDGQSWTPLGELGSGLAGGGVNALAVFDDGSGAQLYVGGEFTYVNDDPIAYIARWDGERWTGLDAGVGGSVTALDVLSDGHGPALYVRGNFYTLGGARAYRIAKWDEAGWDTLDGGLDYSSEVVNDLAVFNDGTGVWVYATGSFTGIGGVPARRIAKWDGSAWSSLGNYGLDNTARALQVFDDGFGAALYVAGDFPEAGGLAARRIARWERTGWSVLDIGINSGTDFNGSASINALAVLDGALYVGGSFESAGVLESRNFARWDGCAGQFAASDFDLDGDVDLDDYALFEGCFGGPDLVYDPLNLPIEWQTGADVNGFIAADSDQDRDVDLRDFWIFQQSMIGP